MSRHPSNACSHEENRKKVCGPCGTKLVVGKKKISNFRLTPNHEKLIRRFINKNYDIDDSRFPLSICTTCRLTLAEHEKNNKNRPLRQMPNYENILLSRITRTSTESADECTVCNCYICLTGRSTNHKANIVAPGVKKELSTVITVSNGLYGSQNSKVTTLPKIDKSYSKSKKIDVIKLCKLCKSEVHKGKKHNCGNRPHTIRNNVRKLVDELPSEQKEHIASGVIEEKAVVIDDDSFTLRTRGRQKRIFLKKKKADVSFSLKDLDELHTDTACSARKMNKMTKFLRYCAGRKSVSANYSQNMSERAKLLDNNYKISVLKFDTSNSRIKEERPVIWTDAETIIETVLEKRSFVGNYIVKVMADGGQGFFKVCLSLLSITQEQLSSEDEYESAPAKKRKSESHKINASCPDTSVKKLIMLCIVPDVTETYANIKILFDLININRISFKFVADFKLLLIINGQQTATSMYPCPYCLVSLGDLRKNPDDKNIYDNVSTLKTYGQLKKDHKDYCALGSKKKFSKKCHSTVKEPLFDEHNDTLILEKCIIPELHLLQGFVNHLFWDGLVPLVGREKALVWPTKLKLVSKNYHGEVFEGNACKRLLEQADKLHDKEIYKDISIFAITPYITAFKTMNEIVNSCFSLKRLKTIDEIEKLIAELYKALLTIETSETLKVHVLLEHLTDSLKLLDSTQGLGLWSEQAGEAVHREFLRFWERRKINLITDSSYSLRLKDATVEFSSFHI